MDFKVVYDTLKKKEEEALRERRSLEEELSKWLEGQENWKVFILGWIIPNNLEIGSEVDYLHEHLSSTIRDLHIWEKFVTFKIKVYGDNFSNFWLDVNFPIEALSGISGFIKVDNDFVKGKISRTEKRIKGCEEEIDFYTKQKENYQKELERLKRWLE